MRIKLTFQNGHMNAANGQTGTAGERDLVDKVYYAIKKIIDSKYSQIIELSYDDATVRNGVTADFFIALHFDGSTNSTYNGGFVDDSPTDEVATDSWKFAQIVADNYFNPMGIRFAPEHRTANSTYYYAFNATGQNTRQFIIELGTLTNPQDKAKLQDVGKIATLLVQGITNYLSQYNQTFKDWLKGSGSQPSPTPIPNTTEIDGLRKQLEEKTKLVDALKTEKEVVSKQLLECQLTLQAITDRLNKIKVYTANT